MTILQTKKIKLIGRITIAALAVFGTSCSMSGRFGSNAEKIVVDGSDIKNEFEVSSLIDSISIVKLQEEKGHFIGEPYKIFKSRDNYIVFDKQVAKRILVFDKHGTFIKNVIDIGKGPDEALQLNDCWINDEGNLDVYDFSLKKIYVFNEDFKVQKVVTARSPLLFTSLISLPKSSEYAGYKGYTPYNEPYKGDYYKFALLDSLVGVKQIDLKYPGNLNDVLVSTPINPFTRYKDSVRLSQDFDPIIYAVTADGLKKRYELSYIHHPFPANFEDVIVKNNLPVLKSAEPDLTKIMNLYKGYTGYRGVWLETEDYILFNSFDVNFKPFLSLYSKKQKRVLANMKNLTENDRYKLILPSFYTTDSKQNTFISIYPGYMLKKLFAKDSPLMKVIDQDIEGNYIVSVKLK
jgi:hypothetical protein